MIISIIITYNNDNDNHDNNTRVWCTALEAVDVQSARLWRTSAACDSTESVRVVPTHRCHYL